MGEGDWGAEALTHQIDKVVAVLKLTQCLSHTTVKLVHIVIVMVYQGTAEKQQPWLMLSFLWKHSVKKTVPMIVLLHCTIFIFFAC